MGGAEREEMDKDGFLYFVGRRDNLIKSSGFRISPTEVEDVLCRFGTVAAAAAIGEPDKVLGQRIKAYVVPVNADPVNTTALLDFCTAEMPGHMVPKAIEVVDELPKTGSGKVDYPALKRLAGV